MKLATASTQIGNTVSRRIGFPLLCLFPAAPLDRA
jgi:hypothetical protein